jgi:hypothetical protein
MEAGKEAAQKASQTLGASPDLFIVLSSVAMHHPEVINGIRQSFPQTPLIGCSTSGEISVSGLIRESVVVMALKSDQMGFTVAKGGNARENARQAGRTLAENIKQSSPEEVTSLLLFSDVMGASGTELTRGVLDVFGKDFMVVGGAAGDDMNFKDTHEYFNDEVLSGYAVGVGLSGQYKKVFGAKHGWEKVGAAKKVTKAKGTIVYEIDGKPAFEIYRDYLGEKAEELKKGFLTYASMTYPLGMSAPGVEGYMIRVPLVINPDGSMVLGAEAVEGTNVNIMMGSQQNAINAAEEAARNVVAEFNGKKPEALFISSCVSRLKLLGPNAPKEIEKVVAVTGKETPTIGFYSYGQHAPVYGIVNDINSCDPGFYEASIVLFAIGE